MNKQVLSACSDESWKVSTWLWCQIPNSIVQYTFGLCQVYRFFFTQLLIEKKWLQFQLTNITLTIAVHKVLFQSFWTANQEYFSSICNKCGCTKRIKLIWHWFWNGLKVDGWILIIIYLKECQFKLTSKLSC